MAKDTISAQQARRIALHALGLTGKDRSKSATWRQIKPELERLHLLQIDSVNVLCRSHYLPMFSRLGAYDRAALDQRSLNSKGRTLFECWAHEASFVRMELHPLTRWRMNRARAGNGTYKQMDRFSKENRNYLKQVLKFIHSHGAVAQSDLPEKHKGEGGWWGWSKNKLALECLFDQGLLTTARREGFERIYDLTERVIPASILDVPTPAEADCFRQLTAMAAQSLGVGTAFDLRDYFRLPVNEAARALQDCVEEGVIVPVAVEGWKAQGYMHRDAKIPRAAATTALVTPFDPICWYRERAERVFGFHYRIELYTPAPKRKFGYYVLPFLHGDRFVGRVCLKADREKSILRVNTSHHEGDTRAEEVASPLAGELRLLAKWLALESIHVASSGNLAPDLRMHFT